MQLQLPRSCNLAINPSQLTMEGGANLLATNIKSEIQLPHVPIVVAECVGVLLEQQVLQHSAFSHEAEQVVVAAKEHVEAHLQDTAKGNTLGHELGQLW